MLRILFAVLGVVATLVQGHAMAQEKTDLTVAAPWEVASYDPAVSGFAFQRLQIMENLVDADVDGTLRPGLATSWSVSEDGLAWTFKLRSGVTFHDGSLFNASSATKSLNRAWQQPGILKKAPITGISGSDGSVVITLDRPFTSLPALLTHATTIISSPTSFDENANPVALIGTGPFKVKSFTPPQSMTLMRNENYWGVASKLTSITYLASGRAETRALLAESGDADMVFTLDPSGFARLENVESIDTVALPIPRVVTLKINASHPFLSDVRARKALSMAIDRDGIAAAITRFPESASSQLFPPALNIWHDRNLESLDHDTGAARAMLADLGWKAGSDGILQRDGERFSILLRTYPDRPELPLIAAALQDQWGDIGVDLDVSVANYSEIPAGHQDGTLHVALYARNYGLTPDPIGTVLADFGSGGGDWGAMGWDNAVVAKALETISATRDKAVRNESIQKVVHALHSELPVIPIVWYQHTVAVADGLENVAIDPLERSYGLSIISWEN